MNVDQAQAYKHNTFIDLWALYLLYCNMSCATSLKLRGPKHNAHCTSLYVLDVFIIFLEKRDMVYIF